MWTCAGNRFRPGVVGRWLTTSILVVALVLAAGIPASGQEPSAGDSDDVAAFFDELMAEHQEEYDLAGAVVAVVKDGEVVHTGGYGHADLGDQTPSDPVLTLFRIGSITKLFTWTAVMQLVEDGEIDLQEDIRAYLSGFDLPADDGPITMEHLMSHSAGFDERIVGLFANEPDELQPLGDELREGFPPQIRAPGEFSTYSNHGTALAGYILEQVSGLSWEEYIEENIFSPLEMQRTTGRQPLPEELAPDMAEGYQDVGGDQDAYGFEYLTIPPAGSISSTAEDMANFMIAHLNHGELDGERILEGSTAEQMHSQHFSHHPEVGGWAHGFMERYYNEQRVIGHDGATLVFVSNLWLKPDDDLGLFLSYNTREGAGESGLEVIQEFFDRYYPVPDPSVPEPPAGSEGRASEVSGDYRSAQNPETAIDKIVSLFGVMSVEEDDGRLRMQIPETDTIEYSEVSPYVFEDVDGEGPLGTLAFPADDEEHDDMMFVENMPETAFERISWYETPMFNFILLGAMMLLFLSAVIAWPINALRLRDREADEDRIARVARPVAGIASGFYIVLAVSLGVALSDDPNEIAFGIPTLIELGLAFALIAAVLAIPAAVFAVFAWLRGHWSTLGRIHYTLVALAAVTMIWWLNYWNLLGFQY